MAKKILKRSFLPILLAVVIFSVVVGMVFVGAQHYDCQEHVTTEICVICPAIKDGRNLVSSSGVGTGLGALLFAFVLVIGIACFLVHERKTLINLKTRLNN